MSLANAGAPSRRANPSLVPTVLRQAGDRPYRAVIQRVFACYVVSAAVEHVNDYVETIRRYDPFLDAMKPATAQKVAHDNFLAVLSKRVRTSVVRGGSVENTTKLVIQRFFSEVLNGGNYSLLDELIGRDFVDHTPSPGQPGGTAGVRAKVEGLRRAFLDLRFILEEAVAEGGTVAVRYYWTGTHKAAFLDVAPTGRTVVVRGMDFYRVRNGAIVEHWHTVDELGLLRQLGRV